MTVTLNNRAYLEDTIRSVLAQTYPAIEYVVIDGGSTDGTAEVIKAHASRLAGWVSEPDQGIADAFNKGLQRTTGDYVLFLNSDDRLSDADAVGALMREAARADCPDIVHGDCVLVERDSGRQVRRLSIGFSRLGFMLGRIIPHPSLFMHRSYFTRYGAFDTSFRIAMDLDLLLRGAFTCRILRVRRVATAMRLGGTSTRNREALVEEIIRAVRKNGLVRSRAGELLLRNYFAVRRLLRPMWRWLNARKHPQ